jgi:hypothetical protein
MTTLLHDVIILKENKMSIQTLGCKKINNKKWSFKVKVGEKTRWYKLIISPINNFHKTIER